MKTLQLSSFGEPADVVDLAEIEDADPGPAQLEVAIEAATINPSDLMLIRGVYGVRPETHCSSRCSASTRSRPTRFCTAT
jgi:NADPH:quinone reductase-like Zn-dependent oxidoreductase